MVCHGCHSGTCCNRTSLTLIVNTALILISFACLSLVLAVRNQDYSDEQVIADASLVCVGCHLLNNHIATEDETSVLTKLHRTKDGKTEKCCAQTPEQLTDILDLCLHRISSKESKPTSLKTQGKWDTAYNSVSSHKRLLPPAGSTGGLQFISNSTAVLKLSSTHQEQLVEHTHNIEALPSSLRILYSGMYYISSEVFYNPQSLKPCREFAVKTWNHTVVRARPNERQSSGVILSSLHTCCDDCKSDKERSYTGGVFQLEAGDHLHVEVSGYGLVSFHRDASYLGVSMLGHLNAM